MKKTFYSWLIQFRDDDSPLGDLARDAKIDKNFPRHATTQKYLCTYLEKQNACDGAIQTLNDAFVIYQKNCNL